MKVTNVAAPPPGKINFRTVARTMKAKNFIFMDYAAYQVGQSGSLPRATKVLNLFMTSAANIFFCIFDFSL